MTDPAAGYDAGDRAHVSERQKRRRLKGERNVGLLVLADITRLCPELYARMVGEQQGEA